MERSVDTVVVGAGISGLTYACARGVEADLLVLETSGRPGGLIRTERLAVGGTEVRFECGPEALQDGPALREVFDELGLRVVGADATAARRYVLDGRGRLRPFPLSPGALLATPLLSPLAKLRALLEPLLPAELGLDDSVADFMRKRFGAAVLERLVDPAVTGIYAGDPELLSLKAAFPMLHALVSRYGSVLAGLVAQARQRRREGQGATLAPLVAPEGGMQALVEALATRLGPHLRLGAPVRVARPQDGGWAVELFHEGRTEQIRCERLVLAVPARVAARLLLRDAPLLGSQLATIVSESVVSVAHVWRRTQVAGPLDGFGYLVPGDLERAHLGTLFSSSIRPDSVRPAGELVVLRTLLGGARHPQIVDWPDEEVVAQAVQEVRPVLGIEGEPLASHVARWRAALPRYDLDHPTREQRITALLSERPGLSLLGNWRHGIALPALVAAARELAAEHAGRRLPGGARVG